MRLAYRQNLYLLPRILLAVGCIIDCRIAKAAPFYIGSDVSLVPFFESQNSIYKASASSAAQPPDQILYDAGDNLFRVRLFVNPSTNYATTVGGPGAIQSQAFDISLMQTLKANDPNAALELDLMYSDSWADPGKQNKPAAWASDTQTQLNTDVGNYTTNTLTAFKNAGVMPDIVQLGNEINSGFMWGTQSNSAGGRITFNTNPTTAGWANFAGLMNTAISAVRTVQGSGPHVQIGIHIANGAQSGEPQFYFNALQAAGVTDYDVEGVSFYPNSTGNPSITLAGLKTNLTALANTYPNKKIIVEETNYPLATRANYDGWAETPAGQAQEYADVKNLLLGLPNGAGEGLVYWAPEVVQAPGVNANNAGTTAMFTLQSGTNNTWIFNPNMAAAFAVPEPSTGMLALAAMFGLASRRRAA
ncbi:MAG TPA: glycosyl hydrolase 53 family protein [Tepidisphaeraceae bacterium]|nr:glycosyl hydrolase 53 family protein [Tepidisphaeraceae bacterium]